MSTQTRQVYRGHQRKLVLAFDLGTNYSGISYSVLEPGEAPEVKGATRFLAHELISSPSKIPTVIYYNQSGKVEAAGAGVLKMGIYKTAEDENWVRTELFKVHLTPKAVDLSPLQVPVNKTVVAVFADFFKYLLECAYSHIRDTHADGPDLWDSVRLNIDFVLSYPNGWEGTQLNELRQAAVLAGLVPDNPSGHSRLLFVTEGETSLHFSLQNGLLAGVENGDGIMVADAGSGTIYISSYRRNTNSSKGSFEEIGPSQCHFFGIVSAAYYARQFLANHLSDSPYLKDLVHIIDETTKLQFKPVEEPQYVKFGSTTDNDESHDIRGGQLKLMGSDVAPFFQRSVNCIVNVVLEQNKTARNTISHVVLVGEFAANTDWLYIGVHDMLAPHGLKIVCPENHVNKAVSVRSDGTILFYLDRIKDSLSPRTEYLPSYTARPPSRAITPTNPVVTQQLPSQFTTKPPHDLQPESMISPGDSGRERPDFLPVPRPPWGGLQQESMVSPNDYNRERPSTPSVTAKQRMSLPSTSRSWLGLQRESELGDYDRDRPDTPPITAKQRTPPLSTHRPWLGLQREAMMEPGNYSRERLDAAPVITEQRSSSPFTHRSLQSVVSLPDMSPVKSNKQKISPPSTSRPWLGLQRESMIELGNYDREHLDTPPVITQQRSSSPFTQPHSRRESMASMGSFNFERPDTTPVKNKQRISPPSNHPLDLRAESMISPGYYDRERSCTPPIIITKKERIPPPSIHRYDTQSSLSSHSSTERHGNIINPQPPFPEDNHQLLVQEYHRMQKELKQVYGDLENCEHELRRSRADKREDDDHIDNLQNALNDIHQQLAETKFPLAETKSLSDVSGTKVSSIRPLGLPILEVREKVKALNEEIFQAAAAFGESLERDRSKISRSSMDAAFAESLEIVGLEMTKLLLAQSQNPAVKPLLVQVILQIFMVKFCVSKIFSWHPSETAIKEFLTATYSKMCSTEDQTVSAKWRALTCAYTRPSTKPSTETWRKEFFHKLMSVLKVAAWIGSRSDYESFQKSRLPSVFEAVQDLRAALEGITPADLNICVFDYDTTFDPSLMVDVDDKGSHPYNSPRADEAIFGTTGMGLRKEGTQQFQTVLRADIVLRSALSEVAEPEPIQTGSIKLKKKKIGAKSVP